MAKPKETRQGRLKQIADLADGLLPVLNSVRMASKANGKEKQRLADAVEYLEWTLAAKRETRGVKTNGFSLKKEPEAWEHYQLVEEAYRAVLPTRPTPGVSLPFTEAGIEVFIATAVEEMNKMRAKKELKNSLHLGTAVYLFTAMKSLAKEKESTNAE